MRTFDELDDSSTPHFQIQKSFLYVLAEKSLNFGVVSVVGEEESTYIIPFNDFMPEIPRSAQADLYIGVFIRNCAESLLKTLF